MIYGIVQMVVLVITGLERSDNMKDIKKKSGLRYVNCDNCGSKIYEGDSIYYTSGILYQCCSAGCLARLMLDVRCDTLENNYLDHEEIVWDGKDE